MWRGDVPTQRNPMELVTIKGASKRTSKPRSLTVDEFQRFVQHLGEPFRTVALVCVCASAFVSARRWRCAGRMWIGSTGDSAFNVASFDNEWMM